LTLTSLSVTTGCVFRSEASQVNSARNNTSILTLKLCIKLISDFRWGCIDTQGTRFEQLQIRWTTSRPGMKNDLIDNYTSIENTKPKCNELFYQRIHIVRILKVSILRVQRDQIFLKYRKI
jgi:hypothetical protein